MNYQTLINPQSLSEILAQQDLIILDCRFSLGDGEAGRKAYQLEHIPGAVYVHLDEDLSGPIIPGKTSRHPLPTIADFAQKLGQWGIDQDKQVIAYDDRGGAIAARLWWMLNWLGHEKVAVLDGGWPHWQKAGYPTTAEIKVPRPSQFIAQERRGHLVTVEELSASLDQAICLFDSRSPERYRGEEEPIDPIAGHIPGADNAPFAENLDAEGHFLSAELLAERFQKILGETPVQEAIFYCGSGVTAAHNLLALAHSGLGRARLYAGSWSEWITDPQRPIAQA